MIYLDNAATTKMFEESKQVYDKFACERFYNPSAVYSKAFEISNEISDAKTSLLKKLGALDGDILFTGGATESNNLAIRGSIRQGDYEYIFSSGEHPSVNNVAEELKKQGYKVHYIALRENGKIDLEELKNKLNSKTRLISIIHVSNETGAVNDIKQISDLRARFSPKALLHVDGVQAFCKIPFAINDLGCDFYTVSAHKFHGPKGVGALYVKNKAGLKPIIFGGGQENGLRSGTENVPGIMAMKTAFEKINVEENYFKVKALKESFLSCFKDLTEVEYIQAESPYIISIAFKGVNGETLARAVEKEVLVSTGSACSAKKAGNRILSNMKLSLQRITSSIRVSFNGYMSSEEVISAGKVLKEEYLNLRRVLG